MADNNDKVTFLLDLDIKDFAEQGLKAKGIITEIGSADNLTGLLQGLTETTLALGAVGLAVYAFKEALDLTIEGEEIQRIENQFEKLAQQAGLSGKDLKEGMEQAAGGLITTNELLQDANKFIVEMGDSASKLPQIMELARKATALFGGDLQTNFNSMAQAIASGNTRMLKHLGILVDANKAYRDFANANGIAENALSQSGKQAAILNAVLEETGKHWANVNVGAESTKTALQELSTSLKEIKELFTVVFSRTIGTFVSDALKSVGSFARQSKDLLLEAFGGADKKLDAQIDLLKSRIGEIDSAISKLKNHEGLFAKIMPNVVTEAMIDANVVQLKKLKAELEDLEKKKAAIASEDQKHAAAEKESDADKSARLQKEHTNQEALRKDKLHFDEEMLKIDQKAEKEHEKGVNSQEDIDKAISAQRVERYRQEHETLKKIQADTALSHEQKVKLMQAEDKRFEEQEKNNARDTEKEREKLNQQYVNNSKNAFDGVGRAAKQMSDKNKAELKDFGKQGTFVMDSFAKNSTGAFDTIGKGIAANQNVAQAAADAMKNAFLGMIGDVAQHYGEMMLLASVVPPDPVGLAAGAALITLGGVLHGMAGGGGSSSVSSVSGGGGDSGYGASGTVVGQQAPVAQQDQSQLQQQVTPQRTVSINIAGNYLNTAESQRTLMEVMRNETDATDFSYNKIGV